MLSYADEKDRHIGGVDETDQRSNHVAHRVALGDDEAVESADGAERRVEVARLGDGVCSHKGLCAIQYVCRICMTEGGCLVDEPRQP